MVRVWNFVIKYFKVFPQNISIFSHFGFVTYLTFLWGESLIEKLGHTGAKVIQRIMGLLLMVIAIQFIITGVETIFKRIYIN